MIFQHTWQLILAGRKTQTRRIATDDAPRWIVGRSYAVQPGRTQRAVGRIVVTALRKERLDDISEADAQAEGYNSREEFIATWRRIHGKYDPDTEVWVIEFRPEMEMR
jgi:hypothetical protein